MFSIWEVKMRAILCLMLVVAYTFADKYDNRRNKLPFVADAVGNSLPPPSNVPATVGSPVNLLTPDRYEFYTFDESGELVKRLMTLEEIQAIVAAGEETEALVTSPNEPTAAFNVHQPPYNKVHSVVTNVQNVLKAQMEAHKNRPYIQPTLDTPDVSDSWSLILPSIFGNTGVDIVLDKSSGAVTTPDTETIEETIEDDDENSLSKEGNYQVLASSTIAVDENIIITDKTPVKDDKPISTTKVTTPTTSVATLTQKPTTTTLKPTTLTVKTTVTTQKSTSTTPKPTTTTPKPTTTTPKSIITTPKPTSTTPKPTSTTPKPTFTTPKPTTTTAKPTTTKSTITTPKAATTIPTPIASKVTTTTTRKATTTTVKPITTASVTTSTKRPTIVSSKKPSPLTRITTSNVNQTKTTTKPQTTLTPYHPTTNKPPTTKTTAKATTSKLEPTTTNKYIIINSTTPASDGNDIKVQIQPDSNTVSSTERNKIEFERISTFVPVSTVKYVSERTTRKPVVFTTTPFVPTGTTTKRYVFINNKTPTQTVKVQSLSTTFRPTLNSFSTSTVRNQNDEKINSTTITTQSVSPSTTVSSTEFLSFDKINAPNNVDDKYNNDEREPLPLFDVAQSISQIASDLGGNYEPIPTTSDLLDATNASQLDLESKENLDIDIPSGTVNETSVKITDNVEANNDNFIKISTIDPSNKNKKKQEDNLVNKNKTEIKNIPIKENVHKNVIVDSVQKIKLTSTLVTTEPTTIDPILSDSMGDLLSQVVNQAPSIIGSEKQQQDISTTTTHSLTLATTPNLNNIDTTSEIYLKVKKDTSSTTEKSFGVESEEPLKKVNETVSTNDLNIQIKVPEIDTVDTFSKQNEVVKLSDKTNLNDSNFIVIPESVTKNDLKVNASKNKEVLQNEDEKYTPEKLSSKSDQKISKPLSDTESSTESTTTFTNVDLPSKTATVNKITPPKINKIDINNKIDSVIKNGKVPEPLPKVDDFRKKIQKVNIDDEELISHRNNSWKLIPTLSPPKVNEILKEKVKSDDQPNHESNENKDVVLDFSNENQGLEVTTKDLGEDIARFSELSNELAFRYWNVLTDDMDKRRSFVFSPYSTFSLLAMIFMGARGATSGEMNEILKLDDMVTFNPHFTLKNISDSIEATPQSGVAISVFTRQLYSDRNKGKILTFYKERAQHFYNGHVEEINFKLISDIIRRRTNLLVKRYTWGRMPEYMKTNNIVMQPPLAAFAANIFETDCSSTSVEGRDGEMYFVVSPNVRQRRLVPVPAVVYKKGFLAGYDPVLDVTVAALGNTNTIVSTLFLMPGQQGNVVHADDLEKLEQRLLESIPTTPTWNRVLRTLLPRTGLELQIPRFSHKSTFNASLTLKKMGLKDLFDGEHADLGGLNGPSKDLYLSDMVQLNTFVTCGEGVVGEQHHIEEYPETITVSQRRRARWLNDWDEPRDYQRAFHDPHDISDAMNLPLHLRPRQARLPSRSNQSARLKFDRPFLYFVRHNPSGMILYFGRYNPRLLP